MSSTVNGIVRQVSETIPEELAARVEAAVAWLIQPLNQTVKRSK